MPLSAGPSPSPSPSPSPRGAQGPRPRPALGWLALLAVVAGAGCRYTEIRTQCPTCTVVSRRVPSPPTPPGTHTLFLLVPGLLGFGWEWDRPLARLRAVPGASIQVFDWRPGSSPGRAGRDLARLLDGVLAVAAGPTQVVVIGHSAGGLVTARAAAEVQVPPGRRVEVVNIGTPYAGMHTTPFDGPLDAWWAPTTLAIGGVFSAASYRPPAPRVSVESWITPWPGDPVMKPRFGHHPDDPRVGPGGARHLAPPGTDHNHFVGDVVDAVAARVEGAAPGALTAGPKGPLRP